MSDLRKAVRRLAARSPELRRHLAPLLKEASTGWRDLARAMSEAQSDPTPRAMGELSDYAINVFREAARAQGYDRSEYKAMVREELKRVRGLPATQQGLLRYLKMSRAGSPYRFSRTMRAALFVQLVAKGVIR